MAMSDAIKFQNLLPGVYTSESRDFQILCRACDVLFNGAKYDIDSMISTLETSNIRNTLLPLLKTKLGFLSNVHLTDAELRLILQAIPYIIKSKGSRKALFYAVNTYAKIHKLNSPITIVINNKITVSDVDSLGNPREVYKNSYTIEIGLKSSFDDLYILTELLSYAIPCGYNLQYYYYNDLQYSTDTAYDSIVKYAPVPKSDFEVAHNDDGSITYTYIPNTEESED